MAIDFHNIFPRAERPRRDTERFAGPDDDRRERLLEARTRAEADDVWLLESSTGGGALLQRTPIQPIPFRVGRAATLDLVLPSPHVSKTHAEIYSDGEVLRVRDLGSRNGTYLNRQPVADAALHRGDILHFGDLEFRVSSDDGNGRESAECARTIIHRGTLSRQFPTGASDIRELIREGLVTIVFQPIVDVPTNRVVACEALGRGCHPDLPEDPVELFEVTGELGREAQAELGRLLRWRAVEFVKGRARPPLLFLNSHPAELELPGFVESIEELRRYAPNVELVLEIHETALAQTDFIIWLRSRLMEIDVGLAYDDFGAGQARLFELAEAPPHYLKFDRRFVTGIDHAPSSRQRLVASLVAAARELLVQTIAEGVETEEEAAACARAGFSHAQGYHYGLPGPVENLD